MLFEKILTFVLFLGPLVFFHELGHFFFARLFGVRVEVFSLGFGPKLFKYKKGDTEYALSLIPLGGYVKMFGDDPFNQDAVPVDQRKFSFTHQSKWARFWIVMGGPLANFILAFVLFFVLLFNGEKIPEIKLGQVDHQSVLYQQGFRAGDVILKINGNDVYNPTDLMIDAKTSVSIVAVKRDSKIEELKVNLVGDKFFEEVVKHPPFLRKPYLVDQKGNKYVLSAEKGKANLLVSFEELLSFSGTKEFYLYQLQKDFDTALDDAKVDLTSEKIISLQEKDLKGVVEDLEKLNLKPLDLMVRSVNMSSAADKAGIKAGDVLVQLEGNRVSSFEDFRTTLQTIKKDSVEVTIWSQGVDKKVTITPDITPIEDKKLKLIGVYSHVELTKPNFVQTESKGIVGSTIIGLERTWDSVKKTLDGFVKLITNQASFKQIGGPLTIGKVAHDSLTTSLSYFFQLMALISVNLGVVNLFPIPVLDGGHIMFIGLEIINRGPLSRRKMEIAQQVGLSILLMLMIGALFNDFSRFF
ncbi:MAG: RIP metalloprotease RseP [Bacteriovoracaceae bacterium]|jgi:regulator of sigma E protease|nr:RIP metalloprotease RseP [Bacteriovoracaceae bacterium]